MLIRIAALQRARPRAADDAIIAAMPSQQPPPLPSAERAHWLKRLAAAQREVEQLRARIEEHRRSPRFNANLVAAWQASLAHWQHAAAEAQRQLAQFPADPNRPQEPLRWMKV